MSQRIYQRWDTSQIRQHQLLVISVLVLGLTGLPQRYADWRISKAIAALFGGPVNMVWVHRLFGVALLVCLVWHIGYLVGRWRRGTFRASTLPAKRDFVDAWHLIGYLVGLRPKEPSYDRYSFIEKFDYWAATGGSVLMIATGLVIWFKSLSHAVAGPVAYDVAVHLHSLESVLALVFLLVGHVYHVHVAGGIFPLNMVWWNGRMTRHEMEEHHGDELKQLDATEQTAAGQQPAGAVSARPRTEPVREAPAPSAEPSGDDDEA